MTFLEATDLLKSGQLDEVLKILYTDAEAERIKKEATHIFLCKGEMFIQKGANEIALPRMVTYNFAKALSESLNIGFDEV